MQDGNMSHLAIERLAELADGEPSALERQHLAECAMCAAELEAYQRLVAMAADERRRIAPPLTNWRTVGALLREEGLVSSPIHTLPAPAHVSYLQRWTRRAAAVLLLAGGGIFYGRLSAGLPLGQALAIGDTSLMSASLAGGVADVSGEEFASTAVALQALQQAQQEYERAALYLARNDTSTSDFDSDAYAARIAALDEIAGTSLRVLEQSPADPVMNQVYQTTLSARDLTLHRLGTALPVGTRLTRF